ncbi:MAG TPA: hypothetical protein VGH43_15270 [Jatrophihabitans sp.]|jgi:hypothetical protein
MFEDTESYHGRHSAPDEYDLMAGAAPGRPLRHDTFPPVSDPPFQGPRSWDVPAGFVPLRKPRRVGTAKRWAVAVVLILAIAATVAWMLRPEPTHNPPRDRVGKAPSVAAAMTYRSPRGHFVAKFIGHPRTATMNFTVDGRTVSAYMAVDATDKQIVAGYTFAPPLPAASIRNALRGGLVGMARGAQVNDVVEATYEGHPSITATLDDGSGDPASVIVYAYSDSRFYMLAARDDATLALLESRFRTTD